MIKEEKKYVQGGIIAERTRVCDVCGREIRANSVGWAYIQETKTPAQARLMSDQGGRDEFEHICLECWDEAKRDYLRPKRDGAGETDIPHKKEERADAQVRPADVHRSQGHDTAPRGNVHSKDRKENRRR